MPIGSPSDTHTRDIAVIANTKVDQHVQDCIIFRERLMETMAELRCDIKDLGKNNAKMHWLIAMIVGGLVLLPQLPGIISFIKGHP